ncbi:MAG: DUF1540 domain-containing protein [Oscillospiraceae bacterium]|nr:DUF1540 domain-containing protein [Oscillospiraceae bacterium]
MENKYVNKNIECTVKNCANHCPNDNYCALQKINVGKHGCAPEECGSDCRSFVEYGR